MALLNLVPVLNLVCFDYPVQVAHTVLNLIRLHVLNLNSVSGYDEIVDLVATAVHLNLQSFIHCLGTGTVVPVLVSTDRYTKFTYRREINIKLLKQLELAPRKFSWRRVRRCSWRNFRGASACIGKVLLVTQVGQRKQGQGV